MIDKWHKRSAADSFAPSVDKSLEATHRSVPVSQRTPRLSRVFHLRELTGLSISGVGPLFSIAATAGLFAQKAGSFTLVALLIIGLPFLCCSLVLRYLNQKLPQAGASYHWTRVIFGERASILQALVLTLGYFLSIAAIVVPAANYVLAILDPSLQQSQLAQLSAAAVMLVLTGIVLCLGSKPVGWIIKIFLVIEGLALVGIIVLSLVHLFVHGLVNIHPHKMLQTQHNKSVGLSVPVFGIIVTAIMAAPILDGWEVDSYAAEESILPRKDPGIGGIVGVTVSIVIYLVVFPLLFSQVSRHILVGGGNPIVSWGAQIFPADPSLLLLPIITSACGVLLLITYILSRALFSMGRDKILPNAFMHLSKKNVPSIIIITSLGAALLVVCLEVFAISLTGFFTMFLSSAGFFLNYYLAY